VKKSENPAPEGRQKLCPNKRLLNPPQTIADDDSGLLKATPILQQWADRAEKGQLSQKETKLDSEFIQHIFGDAPNSLGKEREH
jgi:hypothetical protein